MVKRRQDWPIKLHSEIKKLEDRPFKYGSHDCCLSVANCVRAMTGVDAASEFRGKYNSKFGAYKFIKSRKGMVQMVSDICAKNGWNKVKPHKLQRGDVLVVDDPDMGEMMALVGLDNKFAIITPQGGGLSYVPLEKCRILLAIRIE